MKYFLLLSLISPLCFSATANQTAKMIESEVKADLSESPQGIYGRISTPRLQHRIDQAMNRALRVATEELEKHHEQTMADEINSQWKNDYGASLFSTRGIGAHTPLSQWVTDVYNRIENVLGKDFCIQSHIADIKTINYTVPVVFHPCTFNMDSVQGDRSDEYKRHFCGKSTQVLDEDYHGLVPVVVYWVAYIGCDAGTSGLGFMFVCGTAGGLAEQIMSNRIAPKLSDKVYDHFCSVNY